MTWDTVNVLTIPQAREIVGKLAGKILNVLVMYQVGTCLVLCPFPCDVIDMYPPGTPVLAPSVRLLFLVKLSRHLPPSSNSAILPAGTSSPMTHSRNSSSPCTGSTNHVKCFREWFGQMVPQGSHSLGNTRWSITMTTSRTSVPPMASVCRLRNRSTSPQ